MSTALAIECLCYLEQRTDIWLCPHHRYFKDGVRYASVSSIKRALLPDDYDDVDPTVLENARVKGKHVDAYFSEWLSTPTAMVSLRDFREMVAQDFTRDRYKTPDEHADEAEARLEMLLEWWQKSGFVVTSIQHTFFSDADKVAGTSDVTTAELVLDLKLVSKLQPSYVLQLGAYITMDAQQFPQRDPAILHVTKDKVRLVPYDRKKCRQSWQSAVSWWRTMKELK